MLVLLAGFCGGKKGGTAAPSGSRLPSSPRSCPCETLTSHSACSGVGPLLKDTHDRNEPEVQGSVCAEVGIAYSRPFSLPESATSAWGKRLRCGWRSASRHSGGAAKASDPHTPRPQTPGPLQPPSTSHFLSTPQSCLYFKLTNGFPSHLECNPVFPMVSCFPTPPHSPHSGHTGLLSAAGKCQSPSHLRASAHAVPSTWNAHPFA